MLQLVRLEDRVTPTISFGAAYGYDVAGGNELASMTGHQNQVWSVVFSKVRSHLGFPRRTGILVLGNFQIREIDRGYLDRGRWRRKRSADVAAAKRRT